MVRHSVFVLLINALAGSVSALPDGTNHKEFYTFAVSVMDKEDSALYAMAIEEFRKYLRHYPDEVYADDCQFRIAKIYERSGDNHRAVLNYLKLKYLYPASPSKEQAQLNILQLISDRNFRISRAEVEKGVDYDPGEKDRMNRYYDFIQVLWQIDDPKAYRDAIEEFDTFLYDYADHFNAPVIQHRIAELYLKMDEPKSSIACLERIGFLFQERADLPEARMRIAEIYMDALKDYYQAKKNYLIVVRDFAGDRNAAPALMQLAKIEAEKVRPRRPDKALDYLRQVVDEYPESPEAPRALLRSGQLSVEQLNDAERAIRYYLEAEKLYPDAPQAPLALSMAGELHAQRTGDFRKAIEVYKKLAREYPEFRESPEKLFAAAELEEKKFSNTAQAVALYQEVARTFPDTPAAKRADGKLKKYSKK